LDLTCAKLLAAIYARLGKSVQAFGDYAGERSGAPIRAYTRTGDGPITNRNKVYNPDSLVVLDPSLLTDGVVSGLQPGGILLVNTAEAPEALANQFPGIRLATVDATSIARRHGIGSRSVVIVNTTLAGAFVKVMDIPLETLAETYESLGFSSNLEAAREAYENVQVLEDIGEEVASSGEAKVASPWGATLEGDVPDLVETLEGPAPALKTGSWRSQRPEYREPFAPCVTSCPAGNDVIGYVQALATEGEAAAAEILGRSSPFAAVCGRVCPGFCMAACNRIEHDGAVDTRGLERWIADHVPVAQTEVTPAENPRRIAIVGSGPAGLTAAYHLALAGHKVVVYEMEKELGGVLRTGIPEFRLPRDDLDREIDGIMALGVEARCGKAITGDDLAAMAQSYDGVILATGLQWLRPLRVEGADLDGVEQGIHFLSHINSGEQRGLLGRVVVLGGGNTAMDCARSALRAGADSVVVAYRRTRAEMPAIADEIEETLQEGVEIQYQRAPVGFLGRERVEGIELADVEMGPPDESGRRRPMVTDRTALYDCDAVLLALGQGADTDFLPAGWALRDDQIWNGEQPLPVFASGDLATNEGTVAHAIGHGRRVATQVLAALGEDVEIFERPAAAIAVTTADIRFAHFPRHPPTGLLHEPPMERIGDFREATLGLPDASEAQRCLSCGRCTLCDTCLVYCPEGIIRREESGYLIDLDYCKGCGICATECPRGAIVMVQP
jgi:2-oxoacid:acceptor oxidoreductase gamma subunit (pyruvate/2-ketoisovalerate family)/2-oxoacid:acceptor oxidoreductase delta subunit (pyruvate/2-ketoisovalerate family)